MAAPTRRERLRAATVDEIKRAARRLLVADGPAAMSLRAIAREMGMTAPALYRYFPSHDALMDELCADLNTELTAELERARDAVPDQPPGARLVATCRAFRCWAVTHPAEFSFIFANTRRAEAGSPQSGECWSKDRHSAAYEAARRFGRVFMDLIVELWSTHRFPVLDAAEIPEDLRRELERFCEVAGLDDVPVGVAYVFLSGWVRLYGLVALEVFGHLEFAVQDVTALFEAEIAAMAREFRLPVGGADAAP